MKSNATKVDIYYNIRNKVLSIRKRGGYNAGRVIGTSKGEIVHNATFVVSEKGRARVLRNKQKNVHAYVRGEIDWVDGAGCSINKAPTIDNVYRELKNNKVIEVAYNPYLYDSFVQKNDINKKVISAEKVFIIDKAVYAVNPIFKN